MTTTVAPNASFPSPYTPSGLVKDFHSLPHYDFTFHSVSSEFAPEDRAYEEALVQLALPLCLISALFFLYFLIRACCCSTRDFDPFRPSDARRSRFFLIALMFLSCASVAMTIWGSVQASSSVNSFTDSTTATQSLINQLSDEADDVGQVALALANTVNNTAVPGSDKEAKASLITALTSMDNEINTIITRIQGTIKVTQWNDDISTGDKARSVASITFSSLMLLLICLIVMALFCQSFGLLRLCYGFMVFVFFLCWIGCAAELSLSVGGADFCMDPNSYVSREIDDDVATYYILCDGTTVSPLENYFTVAQDNLRAAMTYAKNLSVPSVNLTVALTGLMADVDALHSVSDCRVSLHGSYQDCVDALCGQGMRAIVLLCFAHGITGLLFLLSLFAIQRVVHSFNAKVTYIVNTTYSDTFPNERSHLLPKNTIL